MTIMDTYKTIIPAIFMCIPNKVNSIKFVYPFFRHAVVPVISTLTVHPFTKG